MVQPDTLKKILVCDDDESILEVIKIILENNGYSVLPLQKGKSIEKKVLDFKPDLILLDLWMSGIGGEEITKILKRNPKTKQIPIIIVSALNETEKISESLGIEGYLSKPFDMDQLLQVVEKYTNP